MEKNYTESVKDSKPLTFEQKLVIEMVRNGYTQDAIKELLDYVREDGIS